MKVLLVSTTFYASPPPAYGGTEMVVWYLAEELNKLGHKVTVAAPQGSKFSPGIEHLATVIPAGAPGGPPVGTMQEDQAWGGIQARIIDPKTNKPTGEFDIVHDHSFRMFSYNVAKDHPSVHVCATIHWQMHWPYLPQVQAGLAPLLPQVKKTNFICLSKLHAVQTSSVLGVPCEFVHNGIDPELYPMVKEKGDRYLFLGRIAKFKGPHVAVDMAEKNHFLLDVAGEDRFVGDTGYVHRVMNACQSWARYLGEVTPAKKLELLQKAKAVILPYAWAEPFGIVPVEANACGTPAIGLNYPGSAMAEVIENGTNGFLCKDFDEMTEATKNVGDIKPEECRRVVLERFTARKQAEKYVSLYERILKGDGW